MFNKTVLTIGALAVAANAVPFKRDVVYVTEIARVVETVAVTHTVWVDAEPTSRRHRHGHGGNDSSAEEATVVAAETTTTEATSSSSTTPVYVAPTTTSSVEETTSSVVEVAPASTPEAESTTSSTTSSTSAYVAPTTTSTTEAYVAPTTTSTTEAYVAPATTEEPSTTSVTPTPTLYEAAVETSAATSDNSASTHTGDLTWYTPGLGSCGWTSTESDAIVALPHGIMTPENGANPNNNPLCGRTITVNYNGATHQAKVVDTCGGCAIDDIDVSPSLFKAIAPNGDGRVHGVSWSLN